MLLRLTLANFLSFRDEVAFSMIATREKQHTDRVFADPERDLKVLPIAAVYGANGSGKSNFYRAIESEIWCSTLPSRRKNKFR